MLGPFWFIISISSSISLIRFFFLDDLSFGECGVLKSPTIISTRGSLCDLSCSFFHKLECSCVCDIDVKNTMPKLVGTLGR